jgi:hypothetical protein
MAERHLRLVSSQREVSRLPCVLHLTGVKGSNGKRLNVRCWCMSGQTGKPRLLFTGFPSLGEVDSTTEAVELFHAHQRGELRPLTAV